MSTNLSPSRRNSAAKAAPARQPARAWADYPESARQRAEKRMAVARVYFTTREAGKTKDEANTLARAEWLQQFGEACSGKTIRRLEARVLKFGGVASAPREAYCDGKSCPHVKARRPQAAARSASDPKAEKQTALLRAFSTLEEACAQLATVAAEQAQLLRAHGFSALAAAARGVIPG